MKTFTTNQQVQEIVLAGDVEGLRLMAGKTFFGQNLAGLDAESLVFGLVERMIPGLSALVMVEHLLSFATVKEQKREVGKMVERGLFRKFGVGNTVAPDLIRFSLEKRSPGSPLLDEQARLISENNLLLKRAASRVE